MQIEPSAPGLCAAVIANDIIEEMTEEAKNKVDQPKEWLLSCGAHGAYMGIF